jgi:DNA-binding XRE family transcriptional regulator
MLELTKMPPIESSENQKNIGNWREVFKDRIEKKTEQGAALTGLRIHHGDTQEEFAKILGVSQPNLSSMENGKRAISKKMAKRIEEIFKVNYRIFI